MSTATEPIDDILKKTYDAGFVTDIEQEYAPPGLSEDDREVHLEEEAGAPVAARLAAQGVPPLARDERANLGKGRATPRSTTRTICYYAAPKSKDDAPKSLDEVDPELLATYEKLGIPLHEQEVLGRCCRRCRVRQRLGGHDLQGRSSPRRASSSARSPRPCRSTLSWCASTWARSCRRATTSSPPELRGLQRRLVRLHPEGRALPDGAVHLLPHQRRQHRPVRAHADHRRRGRYVSYLEGCTAPMRDENQLHAAVVELVALEDAEIKYSTVQNWYPGDENGKGGIYNFVTKRGLCAASARRSPGPRSRPARRSPGSIRAASCRATTRSASSTRSPSPTTTAGRYRHQDDPPRQEHDVDDHLEGHLRRAWTADLSRRREDHAKAPRTRATTRSATRC